MSKKEIRLRIAGLQQWLKFNRHHDFYFGVLNYQNRLLTLLYTSE